MSSFEGGPFTREDFDVVAQLTIETWNTGIDADWNAPAGTLEWSCQETADHVIDCVFSYAFWLASRAEDVNPFYGELHSRPETSPATMIHALRAVTNMLSGAISAAPPGTRAFIGGSPTAVQTGNLADFAARGGLELVQHAHDIASGLGLTFEPPDDVCRRLIEHTKHWPWHPVIDQTSDAWADLLEMTGRPRP